MRKRIKKPNGKGAGKSGMLTVHQGTDRWSASKNREKEDEKHKRERDVISWTQFFLFMHLVFQVSFSQSASKRESEKSWKTRNTQVPHPESPFILNFICSFCSLFIQSFAVCSLASLSITRYKFPFASHASLHSLLQHLMSRGGLNTEKRSLREVCSRKHVKRRRDVRNQ